MSHYCYIYKQKQDIMAEPCKAGLPAKAYKWCRCMQGCGAVERVYTAYEMGNINGLHLIAELYDDDRLYKRWRTTRLTEYYWVDHRHWILYPQSPYGYKKKTGATDRTNKFADGRAKFNYDNYLEGRDPKYWGRGDE